MFVCVSVCTCLYSFHVSVDRKGCLIHIIQYIVLLSGSPDSFSWVPDITCIIV